MNLEKQVVSLELAKRMKELGFEQEGLFYWKEWNWENQGEPKTTSTGGWKIVGKGFPPYFPDGLEISAFTSSELGEMLPAKIRIEKDPTDILMFEFTCYKTPYHYSCCYMCEERLNDKLFVADTEANARAKMLIYLKENNLL